MADETNFALGDLAVLLEVSTRRESLPPSPEPIVVDESPVLVERVQRGNSAGERLVGDRRSDGINAGGGSDTVLGFGGRDVISGNGGNDTLNGGGGSDRLFGDSGDDTLLGGAGADLLVGGNGRDLLNGGGGDDILDGGGGGDSLAGGAGRDAFLLNIGQGTDTVTDFVVGEDRIGLPDGVSFDQLVLDICNCGTKTLIRYQGNIISVIEDVLPSQLSGLDFAEVLRVQ